MAMYKIELDTEIPQANLEMALKEDAKKFLSLFALKALNLMEGMQKSLQ